MRKYLPFILAFALFLTACGVPTYDDGYNEGWEAGFEAGIEAAYEQGVDDGYYLGYVDGAEDAQSEIEDFVYDYLRDAYKGEPADLPMSVDEASMLLYELEIYTNVPEDIQKAAWTMILYKNYIERLEREIAELTIP